MQNKGKKVPLLVEILHHKLLVCVMLLMSRFLRIVKYQGVTVLCHRHEKLRYFLCPCSPLSVRSSLSVRAEPFSWWNLLIGLYRSLSCMLVSVESWFCSSNGEFLTRWICCENAHYSTSLAENKKRFSYCVHFARIVGFTNVIHTCHQANLVQY
jgi:hypothetical protein